MDERQEALRLLTRPVAMAGIKPNQFPKPGTVDNTVGMVLPKTEPNTAGSSSNPPVKPVTEAGKGFLERNKEAVQKAIDDFVEARPESTAAKMAGATATAVNQVFFPEAAWELIPVGKVAKVLKKGAEAAGILKKVDKAEDAAQVARKAPEPKAAQGSGGGYIKGPTRRKPRRRCELVPYDELECDAGQQAHHVVPDWMLRLGTRGSPDRIPNLPSLEKGPAICLEGGGGNEHSAAHKHIDRPAERIARSGRSTGTPGTITLGQGKAISSRAIEKATGGRKGGGCDRKDIRRQLDEQFKAHNETVLRGVRDARGVTDSIRDALSGGKD